MGSQQEAWLQFYEQAWAMREHKMEELLEEFDDAFTAIEKFKRFETYHKLEVDTLSKQTIYKEIDYTKNPEVQTFPTKKPILIQSSFLEKILIRPYYDSPIDFILDFHELHRDFEAIVELGAGFGQNLFQIHKRGGPQNIPYYAGDYTESGTRLAAKIAKHAPGLDFTSFRFNHNEPDLSAVKPKGRVFVFTCHSIEQVQDLSSDFFDCILNHFEDPLVVHFEPFGFQYDSKQSPYGEVSKAHREYFLKNGWNQNLAHQIVQAKDDKKIKIEFFQKNLFPAHYTNPTSLAIWSRADQ